MSRQLTLYEFQELLLAETARFVADWKRNAEQKPDEYPCLMSEDDWWEQWVADTMG